jgi:hypothetical protein
MPPLEALGLTTHVGGAASFVLMICFFMSYRAYSKTTYRGLY